MSGALGAPNSFQFTAATGTAAKITTTSSTAGTGVVIKALRANTGIVYVGATGITTGTGFFLESGDSVSMQCSDPSRIFAIGSAGGQVCSVLFL